MDNAGAKVLTTRGFITGTRDPRDLRPGTTYERLRDGLTNHQRALWERLIKSTWTFRNPAITLAKLTFVPPPWRVKLADGTIILVPDRRSMYRIGRRYLFDHRTYGWTCKETGIRVTLGGPTNLVLEKEDYSWLPVRGRVVVDVGANDGDTALYFAARGASKVYALEPYPYSVQLAHENLLRNPHVKQVTILMQAVGAEGTLRIDPDFENTVGSAADSTGPTGVEVQKVPLSRLVRQLNLSDAILKMDCEGAEYDAILPATDVTLRTFSHIQLEYHYGPESLAERLEAAGFEVSFTRSRYSFNPYISANPGMRAGYLYAMRKGPPTGSFAS